MSSTRFIGVFTSLAIVSCVLGCSSRTPVAAPSFDPSAAARQALDEFDANKDGNIDAQELEKSPGLKAALPTTDTDKNGMLSEDEIKARIESYRQTQLALIPLSYRISLDGQPLGEAQVRLIPESFLTSAIKQATGTTDAQGAVSFAVTGMEFRGTQLGIYRVEISKKDATGNELIPAKFNSATMLGQEVATGVRELESEIQLVLSSQ